jgi:uncharacterized iron-regulated protein
MKILYFLFLVVSLFADTENKYPNILYKGEKISLKKIVELTNEYDVVLIGEEHDDKQGHEEKLKLIEALNEQYSIQVGMEMFERDQQILLDEYFKDLISEKTFEKEARLWNNFSDYKPILEFCKKKSISLHASNAPRRYVRLVSQKGLYSLTELSEQAKQYFAPIYMINSFRDELYEKKIKNSLGNHSDTNLENMYLAQNLWDATMTETILKSLENKKNKFIHINGRYHSDENLGITHRLKKLKVKVLTISIFKELENDSKNYADVHIITGIRK